MVQDGGKWLIPECEGTDKEETELLVRGVSSTQGGTIGRKKMIYLQDCG